MGRWGVYLPRRCVAFPYLHIGTASEHLTEMFFCGFHKIRRVVDNLNSMEENKLPVSPEGENQVPVAGKEQKPAEVAPQGETGLGLDEVMMALDAVKNADTTLANAETKIIHQNRKLRDIRDGVQPDDIEARVAEEVARQMEALKATKSEEDDVELKAIQTQRAELQAKQKKLLEIATALKNKKTMSDSSGGSNQDKLRPHEDLSTTLNTEQKALYQRMADDRGLTLDQVLKAKAEADRSNTPLVQYLKKLKK